MFIIVLYCFILSVYFVYECLKHVSLRLLRRWFSVCFLCMLFYFIFVLFSLVWHRPVCGVRLSVYDVNRRWSIPVCLSCVQSLVLLVAGARQSYDCLHIVSIRYCLLYCGIIILLYNCIFCIWMFEVFAS